MTGLCQYLLDKWPAHHAIYCRRDNQVVSRGTCQRCDGQPVPESKKATQKLPVTPTAEQIAIMAAQGITYTPPGRCAGCGNK